MKERSIKPRVILIERVEPGDKRTHLDELKSLAEATGYEVVAQVIQKRHMDSKFNIGKGKVKEIKDLVVKKKVDKVIFYNQLKPNQAFNLQEELGIDVIDRFQLILEIFAKHAGSKEAKLQIELAKLKYELPRVKELVRRAKMRELPGISRGPGGYQVDIYYRAVRRRISYITKELERLRKRKQIQRKARFMLRIPLVVLTGYTNAGKTTLFNKLTRETKAVSSSPFSTLSTTTRLVNFRGYQFLISDTIGFIEDLPPLLIEAFHTTLEELIYADLILLVIDISEVVEEIRRKVKASLKVLSEIGVMGKPILLVLNKVDIINEKELNEKIKKIALNIEHKIAISAKTGENIDKLCEMIIRMLPRLRTLRAMIPVDSLPNVFHRFHKLKVKVLEVGEKALVELVFPYGLTPHIQNYISELGGDILVHA